MLNLIQEQKYKLVEKLLDCPQFATNSSRQVLARELSKRISSHISLGATYNGREETLAIVNACLAFEQGIAELTSVLSFFDGGTIAFEAVQVYVDALGFGGLLPFSSNLLPARNPKFVGRDKELASLHNTLQDTNMVAVTALHGLGGVGKTSLAIEYIYRHQRAYNLICWLPAENRLTLELEFIGLLGVLGLPDMPIDTEENRARAVLAVKNGLARRGRGWLLVFDNAEKPEDIAAFRPGGSAGHLIVTSRNIQMGKLGRAVEVDVLTENDALRLLAAYCYPGKTQVGLANNSENLWQNEQEAEIARQLVEELGYLALAIIQAGAYIHATGGSVAGYLTEFRQTALELFGGDFTKPLDYAHTVATTWELSFRRVSELNPAAADFLNLLAFFAPNGIRLRWFSPDAVARNPIAKACLPESLVKLTATNTALSAGLAIILQYSLLQIETAGDVFSLHKLVQRVIRSRLAIQTLATAQKPVAVKQSGWQSFLQSIKLKKRQHLPQFQLNADIYWYNCAVAFVAASFPDETEYTNLAACDALINHVQALLSYYNQKYRTTFQLLPINQARARVIKTDSRDNEVFRGIDLERVGTLFGRAANYYRERIVYTQAKPFYELAIAITEETLGTNHPDLAKWLSNFAGLLKDTGDYTTVDYGCQFQ